MAGADWSGGLGIEFASSGPQQKKKKKRSRSRSRRSRRTGSFIVPIFVRAEKKGPAGKPHGTVSLFFYSVICFFVFLLLLLSDCTGDEKDDNW